VSKVLGLALAAAALSQSGCSKIPQAVESKDVDADPSPNFWKLRAADRQQISQGLSLCLSAILERVGQQEKLLTNGWKEQRIPSWALTTKQATMTTVVFSNEDTPILIALKSEGSQTAVDRCSVLAAANDDLVKAAVDSLEGNFSKNMKMMPHGPWWTADGVRIDNDYASLHVFEPQIFDPQDFRTSAISDIRVYKCKEHCN
jgi:hypothetical protein